MKAFFDTNVLLDVLGPREPFYGASSRAWSMAAKGRITGFFSASILPTVFYIIRKSGGRESARKAVRAIRDTLKYVPLDELISNQAMDSTIADFEDAIQFFSALSAGADVLITRNPKHFPARDIIIQTPEEFLAAHFGMDRPGA